MASLIDSSCATSGSVSDDGFTLSTPLDGCGTYISDSDADTVTFAQSVSAMARTGPIYVGNPLGIDFTCVYDTHSDASTDGDFEQTTSETGSAGTGSFDFSLVLYEDSTFEAAVPDGDVIVVGERVYFSVAGSSLPETVSFIVNDCTISNELYGMSYDIVSGGCADDLTQTMYHNDGPFASDAMLSYAAFRFDTDADLDEDQHEVISCTITVCDNDDETSACQNQPSCARRRRSPSAVDAKLVAVSASYIKRK